MQSWNRRGLSPERLKGLLVRRGSSGLGASGPDVRRQADGGDTFAGHSAQYLHRLFDGSGAVIHRGEEMRVEIDHASARVARRTDPAKSSRPSGACSACASRARVISASAARRSKATERSPAWESTCVSAACAAAESFSGSVEPPEACAYS